MSTFANTTTIRSNTLRTSVTILPTYPQIVASDDAGVMDYVNRHNYRCDNWKCNDLRLTNGDVLIEVCYPDLQDSTTILQGDGSSSPLTTRLPLRILRGLKDGDQIHLQLGDVKVSLIAHQNGEFSQVLERLEKLILG